MTQLGELRDAYRRFADVGIKLYAVSYDDVEALAAFAEAADIPFPLLSDADSALIREFGILNTTVQPDDVPFYGIPNPGTYLVDEDGVVIDKFFPRHIANRESADTIIDSALGEILMAEAEPGTSGGDDDIAVTVRLRGGDGTLKSGIRRRVVVRFELPDGLHIYGEPVPEGMVATSVSVAGPDGLIVEEPVYPPTEPLVLDDLGPELQVWSGCVDVAVPVWANSHLVDLFDTLEGKTVTLEVTVRYQACNDRACLIPRTEKLSLVVPLAPLDVPDVPGLNLDGQRVTSMDSVEYLTRLLQRFG